MKIPLLNLFKRYSQKVGQPPGTLVYLGEERTESVRITIIDYDEIHFQEEEAQTVIDRCYCGPLWLGISIGMFVFFKFKNSSEF